MGQRLLGALACVLALSIACSSTSTNEAGGTGGGGGAPSCNGTGPECHSCCRQPNDDGDGAYLWAVKQCVCGDGASDCAAECCGATVNQQACALCAEAKATSCVSGLCAGAENCSRFRTCLHTCL